ncbi:hypothetical protein pipiens_011529 [Culex pipiens pipiens]|uniref:Uncharacterized protein n=1 Tax=Culex pipiens pipiens TaxID=38569 RepID=A0ABD1D632_CULPP
MECDQRAYERPAFWRIPKAKTFEIPFMKKRVSFSEKVSQFGRAVVAHTQGIPLRTPEEIDSGGIGTTDQQA